MPCRHRRWYSNEDAFWKSSAASQQYCPKLCSSRNLFDCSLFRSIAPSGASCFAPSCFACCRSEQVFWQHIYLMYKPCYFANYAILKGRTSFAEPATYPFYIACQSAPYLTVSVWIVWHIDFGTSSSCQFQNVVCVYGLS